MHEASATRTSGTKLAERTRADLHRAILSPASPHLPFGREPEFLSSERQAKNTGPQCLPIIIWLPARVCHSTLLTSSCIQTKGIARRWSRGFSPLPI